MCSKSPLSILNHLLTFYFAGTMLNKAVAKWSILLIFFFIIIYTMRTSKITINFGDHEDTQRVHHEIKENVHNRSPMEKLDENSQLQKLENPSSIERVEGTAKVESLADLSWILPPAKQNCDDLGKTQNGEEVKYPELYLAHRDAHAAHYKHICNMVGVYDPGNIAFVPKENLLFLNIINQTKFIRTVCEVGFSGGHSSLAWLTGNRNTHVYSFDANFRKFSHLMAEYMDKTFPGRFNIIWGDSKKTIPAFTKKHPGFTCDLVWIDGGHEYPEIKADLRNLRALANKKLHYLLIDDLPIRDDVLGIERAWKEELEAAQVEEFYKCVSPRHSTRGFTLGRYINLP